MPRVNIKSPQEVAIMAEGGKKLGAVKKAVQNLVKAGVTAWELEELATKLIIEAGGVPSFKMVPGYSWTTCININDGIVHGIPTRQMVFAEGDLVSVDLGMFYQGFHTDTSFSVLVGKDSQKEHFLKAGREAINKAVAAVKVGKPLGDISRAIEATLERQGYHPVTSLVGHGVGRELHEAPAIPCFTSGSTQEKLILEAGMVLAIEVMYTLGSPELVTDSDGWTIRTRDGKISALFEETVAVTASGPLVLTKS